MKKIFVSEPYLDHQDTRNILSCIKTGFVTSGSYIKKFEKEIINFTKIRNCVVCVNGTSALQIALRVLGVKENDEVIAPSMTFVATINSIIYNNASPIFMDCDKYLNLDIQKTIKFLRTNTYKLKGETFNKKTKKRIKAVIVAHMYGNLIDIKKFKKICKLMNIKLIEDAAESLGSFYNTGQHSGAIGDSGCGSFNGNKIITSAGGGAIVSKNKNFVDKARKLINQSRSDEIEYIHEELGYNFRISNIHSALGFSQMNKLSRFIKIKKKIYEIYNKGLEGKKNFELIKNNKFSNSNNWINIIKIKNSKINKKKILNFLINNNIEARPIWKPIHQQNYCKKFQTYEIKMAKYMHSRCFCLPSSVNLKKTEANKIINLLNRYEN